MKRIIAIFGVLFVCFIAIGNAYAAQNTEADKRKLADDLQKHYKPGSSSNSSSSSTQMGTGSSSNKCTQSTTQIAACAAACAASCIFKCTPVNGGGFPWSAECKSCSNDCMDHCTGCGKGSIN
jgi:hypothetical protein